MTTTQTTETWTNADAALATKSLKCATLAVGEYRVGNEDAGNTAAYRAGELCCRAGFTLDQLQAEVPALLTTGNCWSFAVDGWYDAQGAQAAA